jgi:type IV pilus assembly protein PilZ
MSSLPTSPNSLWSESVLTGATSRPSILQLRFESQQELYRAYIPLFREGGLFIPTNREYHLGEDLYGLLSLPDDMQRYPVVGAVAWITPPESSAGRTQGVGVRFTADDRGVLLKQKIEASLGPLLSTRRVNHTVS